MLLKDMASSNLDSGSIVESKLYLSTLHGSEEH